MRLLSSTVFLSALAYVLAQDGCPAFTVTTSPTPITALPDPFLSLDGTRISKVSDWACRRAEISALMQAQELGTKPPPPDSLTASFNSTSGVLSITATVGANSVTFPATIKLPATGTGPFPAVIAFDGLSIPLPDGVATIIFGVSQFAQQNDQSSRGVGTFFNLFGSDASAGALMAWAWGVSRIFDAMEQIPNLNIDLQHIGVTGCSRNGKGALVSGAFEERVALTIPQESGSGGDGCWRISDAMFAQGNVTQTAMEIIGENVWFSTNFNPFASTSVNSLMFDHHSLAALVAPRALFAIENSDFLWLGPESTWGCMSTAHTVWEALGIPDMMGYSQVGGHQHCQFPSDQQPQLFAFINKFLLGQPGDTSVLETDGNGWGFDPTVWQDWTVPTLT